MNRRNMIAMFGFMPFIPMANDKLLYSDMIGIPNKDDVVCWIAKDMYNDCKAVYNIDMTKVVPHMHGTHFRIDKVAANVQTLNNEKEARLVFEFSTNDSRDKVITWEQISRIF